MVNEHYIYLPWAMRAFETKGLHETTMGVGNNHQNSGSSLTAFNEWIIICYSKLKPSKPSLWIYLKGIISTSKNCFIWDNFRAMVLYWICTLQHSHYQIQYLLGGFKFSSKLNSPAINHEQYPNIPETNASVTPSLFYCILWWFFKTTSNNSIIST